MQLNGNIFGEYMSRKFTMCMVVIGVFSLKLLISNDAAIVGYLVGGIVGAVTAYGYFNTKETESVKELKLIGISGDPNCDPKPPIEPAATN